MSVRQRRHDELSCGIDEFYVNLRTCPSNLAQVPIQPLIEGPVRWIFEPRNENVVKLADC